MKAEKRTRFQIYFEILLGLRDEMRRMDGKPSLTRVSHRVNMPYDRFQETLVQLVKLDMVSPGDKGEYVVTEKGVEYLQEYRRMAEFLRRMGLS